MVPTMRSPHIAPVITSYSIHYTKLYEEDCAQAHGALWGERMVGTMGDLSCFSFYPTKNLGALGDAGALAGRDEEQRDRARQLRQYGENPRYVCSMAGMNSRLDELQAAFLRVRLARLAALNEERRALSARYMVV